MTDDICFSELIKLQKKNITNDIKRKIKSEIRLNNDINSIIENIEIDFSYHKKYENLSCEILYNHLRIGKLLAQLALNSIKGGEYELCKCHPEIKKQETYEKYFKIIKKKKVDEEFLIDRISYYITIFTLLSYKEFNETCETCNKVLSKNELKCSYCGTSVYDENKIENTKFNETYETSNKVLSKNDLKYSYYGPSVYGEDKIENTKVTEKCRFCESLLLKNESKCSVCEGENQIESKIGKSIEVIDLCKYCNFETIDGICEVCGNKSNQSKTNLQKTNKDDEMRSIIMRSNSPKTSRNSRIISNLPSQWTCNVCSFNQNKSDNINCEVCMSSKFSKINSCVFESVCELSNENKIYSIEHVENISIEDNNAKSVENEDKWACTKCTFNNKITDNLCVVCLEPNIGANGDYELPEETWCCKQCGENNLFECYKCKNCRIPAEFFDKWKCDQCSYYNDKVAKFCIVCDKRNSYLVKCNLCSKNLVNKKYDKICKQCTILTERCTNKQTVDYQDSRETQPGMSEYGNVPDKRSQRRDKINEKQNKSKVSQNIDIKDKDPNVDRKINNKQIDNKNVNKTQPETFKPFPNFDANSEKRNENKVQNKNDGSQNVEGKRKFSNVSISSDYQKTDNLTIYNVVYSAPSETPGSNKSLPKNDRNSGKLNKNQIISNKDIQQKPEPKNKIPNVEAQNKMKSKPCKNCKSNVCANNQYWCTKCENLQWFCKNEACGGINYQNEYCKRCKAKNGSNFSDCINFWVMKDDGKEGQMWQCGFCFQFNAGTLNKCNNCKNHRELPNYKKCICGWNNLSIREKCDKCNADLIKSKI